MFSNTYTPIASNLTTCVSPIYMTSFVAEQYAATAIYGPLALPWFADYMHLVFWFLFLCTFILTLWLVFTFSTLNRGSDSRFLVRETRGFSRAQTGDWVTAVIPMCWSITMIMHANVHSSNFDENTDSTNLIVTIVAYQWGWNYFFPNDIFKKPALPTSSAYATNTAPILPMAVRTTKYCLPVSTALINFADNANLISPSANSALNTTQGVSVVVATPAVSNLANVIIITPNLVEDLDDSFTKLNWLSEFVTARKAGFLSTTSSLVGGLVTRFRLTSGVVLPTDTPIHIICCSQDVIHSWAVPGLLVKIDCIPGYNCHRRLLIRWRGLFWGQCMEVCGRYHHWMPLLLRTSSWEVFSLWLTSLSQNL